MKQRNETTEKKSGKEEGRREEQLEIARRMKREGMKIEDIQKITQLKIKEIEKL